MNCHYFQRIIIATIFIISLTLPVFAQTFNASIEQNYTTDSARQEAFNGAQFFRNVSGFSPKDPFYLENKENILKTGASNFRYKNRTITVFYDYSTKKFTGYTVSEEHSMVTFYFDYLGNLEAVEYETSINYPIKSYRYDYPKGMLIAVGMHVKSGDDYLFHPTGKLLSHCINAKCYNEAGQVTLLREKYIK